ncbi:cation diffusion facilitator family transporter [Thermococcus barophilus]|uniref:Cobalt-zinc-cadmium resistance protein n=1 Tax=Thermococcus barophilus (strain DSM 11836 / MP) TaxID=391623 RepID=F0LL05_THEBM|nr:cation diffusion facilitator family transporter [Thermococcus barophilus]ADT84912.1 cobalt-zinc-cadmium resistance protein [Thermococcus barophilus MP]
MREVYKPIWFSIIGNVLLALLKIAVGFMYSSLALISDGVHSLSDVVTSIIGFIGIRISSKPPDRSHPFGHSRFEPLFAFFMGLALLLVAYEIARDSIGRVLEGTSIEVNSIMLGVAVFSIIFKEGMTQYTLWVGKKLNNQILIADAYHHRSDVLSTIAVLIGLLAEKFGFRYGDSLAGLIVAIFIAKVALEIVMRNVNYLTGTSPPFEICERIKKIALSVDNVVGVHDLRAHYVGPKLHVELHIEVPPNLTLKEAHDVSEEVKRRIEELEEVEMAFVHVDIKGVTK